MNLRLGIIPKVEDQLYIFVFFLDDDTDGCLQARIYDKHEDSTFQLPSYHFSVITYHLLNPMTFIYLSLYVTLVNVHTIRNSLTRLCYVHKNWSKRATRKNDWNRHHLSFTKTIKNWLIDTMYRCLHSLTTCLHGVGSLYTNKVVYSVIFPIVTVCHSVDSHGGWRSTHAVSILLEYMQFPQVFFLALICFFLIDLRDLDIDKLLSP